MANDLQGEIAITIGGGDFTLRITSRVARQIERAMGGRSLIGYVQDAVGSGHGISSDLVITTLFFALRDQVKGLTEAMIEGWVDESENGVAGYMGPVIKAIVLGQGGRAAVKKMEDEEAKKGPRSVPTTASAS
jgi:hypothetical protein